MKSAATIAIAIAIVAIAAAYRLPELADRPMHTDEAVNAVILETLRAEADYTYDPIEHHGPTLPYFALSLLRSLGVGSFSAMTETQLRTVTALFGIALVGLLFALRPLVGSRATLATMLFAAVSPAAVYYSRYYIHEMLLVVFTLLAIVGLWRGIGSTRPGARTLWWITSGLGLGFAHATKETCVIAFAGIGVGLLAAARSENGWRAPGELRYPVAVITTSALLTSIACFSFFGTDARGPLDSVLTFETYLKRAGGNDTLHVQPWWYYAQLLGYTRLGPFRWSEATIFVFGLFGCWAVWRRAVRPPLLESEATFSDDPRFLRFIAAYSITVTGIYVTIPYKTPWCVLEFWVPWMMLAGIGVARLLSHRKRWIAAAGLIGLSAATIHLSRQAYLASFPLTGSYRNPYVYAHPLRGVVQLSEYVGRLVGHHPLGSRTPVLVFTDHPWPLPWYLRDLERVGYWDSAEGSTAWIREHAPPIIIVAEPEAESVAAILPLPYARNTYGQRPGVRLVLYVHPELRSKFVEGAR